jgi:hypothetical protein
MKVRVTKWLRLRAVFAIGVLALVPVELAGHRGWPVVVPQALLIVGIVTTSVVDLREGRKPGQGSTAA